MSMCFCIVSTENAVSPTSILLGLDSEADKIKSLRS